MLLGIWWDHEKDVSALLLLIHPAQVTTSPLFGEAGVQILEEKWPFPRYGFQYIPVTYTHLTLPTILPV